MFVQYKVHKDHYIDDQRWRSSQHLALRTRVIWGANGRALIIIDATEEEANFIRLVRDDAKIVEGMTATRRYHFGT